MAVNATIQRPNDPPPPNSVGPIKWLRDNLFAGPLNTILTFITAIITAWLLYTTVQFLLFGSDWTVVTNNLTLFAVGQYPRSQLWRPAAALGLVLVLAFATPLVWKRNPTAKRVLQVMWLLSPILITYVLYGGFGLPIVRTQLWSGLLLTMMLTIVGIVASFPLGLLLALGRRSDLPIIRGISTAYIELIRGVPLISILFMSQVMLPLFLGIEVDVVIRAMGGVTLFSAAYIAEIVRGGLQAIPRGQIEAANAVGLNPIQTTVFIVLPQALRIVVPTLVGQFISLFKDTSLVSIITLLDLLGITEAALAQNPAFQSHKIEAYLFVGAIYFVLSYVMSQGARRIEKNTARMGGTSDL